MADKSLASLDDLWGPEFGADQPESAILSLLAKQADALSRRTNGEVVGEAVSSVDGGTVWTGLYATVPALGGYRRKILTITYPVDRSPTDPTPVKAYGFNTDDGEEVASMEALVKWLAASLSSSQVHEMIKNLQHYSRESVA